MKQLLISFLFILLFSEFSFASGDKRLDFSMKSANMDNSKPSQAKVVLELKNLTSDTLTFLTWSCAPIQSLLSIDEEDVSLNGIDCDKNVPTFLRILPHQSRVETVLVRSSRADGRVSPFKVKINLIEPQEKHNPSVAKTEANGKRFSLATELIEIK